MDAGLHALRAVLAERARDLRAEAYTAPLDAELLSEWRRDGLIVRDYDQVGDKGLYELLRVVAAEPAALVPKPPYEWTARNVTCEPERDAQSDAHLDSFASVVKIWIFKTPLDARHGPFTFCKGSHRVTERRLRWLHAYALPPAAEALREPSFRLAGSPTAAAAGACFVADCERDARPVLPLPRAKKTLVIADTSAIHWRAVGDPGFVRQSLRIRGDNGGGLQRLDPFRLP